MPTKQPVAPDLIRVLEFHGMELDQSGNAYKGNCPFCDKAGHFYAHPGKDSSEVKFWKCHYCDTKGNLYSFIAQLHKFALENTAETTYKELFKLKGIPSYIARACKLAKSPLTDEWLFPSFNAEGKVINLHRFVPAMNRLLGTPTLLAPMLGLNLLKDDHQTVMIAEGHWDYLILEHVIRKTNQRSEIGVLAVPGCSSLKPEWLAPLAGRHVILLYDNDHPKETKTGKVTQPGLDGMKRFYKEAGKVAIPPASIRCIRWPAGLADGYDVRDLFTDKRKEHAAS